MATKRRRVWVNFYEDGSNDGCAFETKGDAKENASTAYVMTQVGFIERRPGDVVLSREEVANLRGWLTEIERNMWKPNPGLDGNRIAQSIALLRGRR